MKAMNIVLAALAAAIVPSFVGAGTRITCVGSSNELAAALATLANAPGNNDADEIRIRAGAYFAPAGGWIGSVTSGHDLTIRGGYTDAACTQQTLDAAQTTLDGNGSSGVLTIDTPLLPNSNIEVSGLTFQHGRGGNAQESNAGGLKIGDPNPISNGRILVERNIFRDNTATGNGFSQAVGGLLAATDGESLIVRDNLFVGNESPNAPAAYLYSNNEVDVSNNTFVGNHATDATQERRVALAFVSLAAFRASNNIFWNNASGSGSYDLDLTAQFSGFAGATLRNNDLQATIGTAVAETGTRHIDPGFAGNGDWRLAPASPLIDAGVNDPAGGAGDTDLTGAPRLHGAAIDLGAYESASVAAQIGAGFSGNWYDPRANQSGHGLQLEVLPGNGLLAIWFVFDPAAPVQAWIYAQGDYDPATNTAMLPAFLERGGAFPPQFDGGKVTVTPWGALRFTFSDCDSGTVEWTSNATSHAAGYADVGFPIRRLTRIAGTTCP